MTKWEQIYKVDQEFITSYAEGRGTLKTLGASYKYISGETYFSCKEIEKFRKNISQHDLKLIFILLKKLKNYSDQLVKCTKDISKLNLRFKSNEQLCQLFQKFYNHYEKFLGMAAIPIPCRRCY